jgi:DNA-binding phage protein
MPLTRSFKDTVMERIKRDPAFAKGMLFEGINSLLGDEVDVGKDIIRDYINATIGFEKLGKKVGLPPKSLMRMFGPNGNPQAKNLFAVLAVLRKHAGIEFQMAAE